MQLESLRYQYLRRGVAPLLRVLGMRASTAIARRLARGYDALYPPGRRRAESRLRAAFGKAATDSVVDKRASAMYEHIARFWTEALFIPRRFSSERWRRFVEVENETGMRALADAQRGCILTTGYYGNLAAGACALGWIFRPIHVVMDYMAQPALAAWQQELYRQRWVRPIDRRGVVREVPSILEEGGAVLMVGEAERPRGRGVATRFLGRTIDCYPTLGRLARWFDVPVGVITCRRQARLFSFRLKLHEVIEHDGSEHGDDAVVRRAMAALERAVLEAPEQYLWSLPTREHPAAADFAGDQGMPTGRENESASCRTARRTASASRSRSTAGRTPADRAAAVGPAPTA